MHLTLLILSAVTMLCAAAILQRRSGTRKELALMFLFGLFAAYPMKGYLLHIDPSMFATYEDYQATSDRMESYYAYIAFVTLVTLGFLIPRTTTASKVPPPPSTSAWAYINALNALALLSIATIFSGITSPSELLSASARSQFLFAQQGSGWTSLLIVFTIPLLVLGYQSRPRILFYLAFACGLLAQLVIGSRLYLFGYLIAFLICRFSLSLRGTAIMLSALAALGSVIYMGFLGDAMSDVSPMRMLSFVMHTFDGADILNSYLNKDQHAFYYGTTVLEDLLVTYFPRALWEGKPYLFGAIRITTDLFSDLADVQALGATFPPGLFLELYANFSLFAIAIALIFGSLLAWVSDENRTSHPMAFALYVSLCAAAPGFFRGIGTMIAFLLPVIGLLAMLSFSKRIRV